MITLEMQVKVAEWRRKITDKTITDDELKEAVVWLREGRQSAAASAKPKRVSAAKAAESVNSDAMLDELKGL